MSVLQLLQIPLESVPSVVQQPWLDLVTKLASANGVIATYVGTQHENNKVGGLAAVWESLEAQTDWSECEEGNSYNDQLLEKSNGTPTSDIILLAEDPYPVFRAPVVEVVWWIHPVDQITDAKKETVESAFKEFQKALGYQTKGGMVAGWGQKEFDHQGVPTRRFYCLIGWASVDAHLACKKTDVFAENIHLLRDHDHVGVGMVHYPFSAL